MTSQCRTVFYCGAAFLLLPGCAFVLKPGAVWITDNGNKYIMMRNSLPRAKVLLSSMFSLSFFPQGDFTLSKSPVEPSPFTLNI